MINKKHLTMFFAQVLLILTSIFMFSNIAMASNSIQWNTYGKAAFAKSVKQKRPILLFVKADWCPHCTKMRKTTLQDASVIKMVNESFVPVMLDADNDRVMVAKYNVSGLPSFLVLSSKNKVLNEFSGEMSIVDFMQSLSQGYKKYENGVA